MNIFQTRKEKRNSNSNENILFWRKTDKTIWNPSFLREPLFQSPYFWAIFSGPPSLSNFKNQNPPAPNRRLWEHLKTYRKWLTWRRSCYQYIVEYVMVSAEKKRKFPEQCKQMVLDILLKLSERSPLWYAIVWCASRLSLANIVDSPKACV